MNEIKYYIFPISIFLSLIIMIGYAINKDFEYKNRRLDIYSGAYQNKTNCIELQENKNYIAVQKIKGLIELTEHCDIPSWNKNKILNTLNFEKDMLEHDVIRELGKEKYESNKK